MIPGGERMKNRAFSLLKIWLIVVLVFMSVEIAFAELTQGQPPDTPCNPFPCDDATSVQRTANLSWLCADSDNDNLTYSIYFGTSTSPPFIESGWTGEYFNIFNILEAPLNATTTYYWKIVAHDATDSTSSPVWSFTTADNLGSGTVRYGEHTVVSLNSLNATCPGDLDGDGDIDVVGVMGLQDEVSCWLNSDGEGTSWEYHNIATSFDLPVSLALADMDNDGDLDAISCAAFGDAIKWWANNGSGTSWTEYTIDGAIDGASEAFPVDIDGDGDLDIVGAASNAGEYDWWENTGGATSWSYHCISDTATAPSFISAGDLDGDGDMDVVGGSVSSNEEITWFENDNGDGSSWTAHTVATSFGSSDGISVTDMDGDGNLDLLVAINTGSEIAWWENANGDGSSWTKHSVDNAFTANDAIAADVDGDGDPDVIGADYSNGVFAWWENTDGSATSWTKTVLETGPYGPKWIRVADFDGDNLLDILGGAGGSVNYIAWWDVGINQAPGTPSLVSPSNAATGVSNDPTLKWSCADSDGDSMTYSLKLSTSNPPNPVYESGITDTTFAAQLDCETTYYWQIQACDEWGDTSSWSAIWSFTTVPNSAPDEPVLLLPVAGATNVQRTARLSWLGSDVNHDALTYDIYFGTSASPSLVKSNWSGEYFDPVEELEAPMAANTTYYWKIVADDGELSTQSSVQSFTTRSELSGGFFRFDPNEFTNSYSSPYGVHIADIDGDGDKDVIASSMNNSLVSWWENTDGTGSSLTEHQVTDDDYGVFAVKAADLDGDGDLDIVASSLYNPIMWWENFFGDGSYWTVHTVDENSYEFSDIQVADIDGDGDLDVAAVAMEGSDVFWWSNDGTGTSWTSHLITDELYSAFTLCIDDVDADGDMDVVVVDMEYGAALFQNDNGVGTSWTGSSVAEIGEGVTNVCSADPDGDGDRDLVFVTSIGFVFWAENTDGTGTSWSPVLISDSEDPTQFVGGIGLCVTDMDGDGDEDVVTSASTAFISTPPISAPPIAAPPIAAPSLSGQGSGLTNILAWWDNEDGGTTWTMHAIDTSLTGVDNIDVADVNDDGLPDILGSLSSSNCVTWWETTYNRPPDSPSNPYPADGAIDMPRDITLSWDASDADGDSIAFFVDIWFAGTDTAREVSLVDSIDLGVVPFDSTLFWRITVIDEHGDSTQGDVWSFTVKSNDPPNDPHYVYPLDGATNVERTANLHWLCSDVDGQALTYEIYFGTDPGDLTLIYGAWPGEYYPLVDELAGPLAANQDYYWKIIASDSLATTESPIYSFTTTSALPDGNRRVDSLLVISAITNDFNDLDHADIDGDGLEDIVASAGSGDEIIWLKNDIAGGSGWVKHVVDASFPNAIGTCAADIDGDGDIDIVGLAQYNSDTLKWWENTNGDGSSWIGREVHDVLGNPIDLVDTDIDNDGDVDLIVTTSTAAYLFRNENGLGTSWSRGTIRNGTFLVVSTCDFDIDGDVDVFLAGTTTGIIMQENVDSAGSSWNNSTVDASYVYVQAMHVLDLDMDVIPEVLACNSDGNVTIWQYQSGDVPTWIENTVSDTCSGSLDVCPADLDGDGDFDILGTTTDGILLCWENLDGSISSWTEHLLADGLDTPSSVIAANFDNEGQADIICVDQNTGVINQFSISNNIPPEEPVGPSPANEATDIVVQPTLRWQSCSDPDGDPVTYSLYFGLTDPPTEQVGSSLSDTSFTVPSSLEYDTQYFWQVYAYDSMGDSAVGSVWSFTVEVNDPPTAATNLDPEDGSIDTDINLTLSWYSSMDPEGHDFFYRVYGDTADPPVTVVMDSTSDTTLAVTDLDYGTTYYWRIVTVGSMGDSTVSEVWSFTTEVNDPPSAAYGPTPANGIEIEGLETLLSWRPSVDPEGHSFFYKVFGDTLNPPVAVVEDSTADTTLATGELEYGTTYYWQVVTIGSMGDSACSDVWSFSTEVNDPPTAASNPEPENGATEMAISLTLKWESSSDPEGHSFFYKVFGDTLNPPVAVVEDSTTDTTVATGDLEYGTTYYWQVVTIGSMGDSTSSDVWSFTTEINDPPSAVYDPTPANGTEIEGLETLLSWCPSVDPEGHSFHYQVIWDTLNPPVTVVEDSTTDTTFATGELEYGTTYYWQVLTIGSMGDTASSDVWSFTTEINDPPSAVYDPAPADGTEIEGLETLLSWRPSVDPEGHAFFYRVYGDEFSPPTSVVMDSTVDTCMMAGDFDYDHTYYWQVVTIGSMGDTAYSDIWSFSTEINDPPTAASNPEPENGATETAISLTLKWENSSDPEGHQFFYKVLGDTLNPPVAVVEDSTTDTTLATGELEYGTTYYWQVLTIGSMGDTASSDVWSFTTEINDPPSVASNPVPVDDAIDVSIHPTLAWNSSSDPEGHSFFYRIYADTVDPPVTMVEDSTIDTSLYAGELEYGTDYYWRVVTVGCMGDSAMGEVWTFRTVENEPPSPPLNPCPTDEELDVVISPTLTWNQCSDFENDPISYRIYFDTVFPAAQVVVASTLDTSYTPPMLSYGTEYYWRVVVFSDRGDSTVGGDWSFQTVQNSPPGDFAYVSPGDGYVEQTNHYVQVLWTTSVDPNSEQSVRYRIEWSEYEDFSSSYYDETTDTTYIIHEMAGTTGPGAPTNDIIDLASTKRDRRSGKVEASGSRKSTRGRELKSTDRSRSASQSTTMSSNSRPKDNTRDDVNPRKTTSTFNDATEPVPQVDGSLPDDFTVFYRVRALDDLNASTTCLGSDTPFSFEINIPEAPLPFTLQLPEMSAILSCATDTLVWNSSIDPDPYDVVTYDVMVDTLPDLSTAWLAAEGTADTMFEICDLLDDHSYFWTVKAVDSNTDGTWASDTFAFETFIPEAPLGFCMVSPDCECIIATRSIELVWEQAHDPDPGDTLLYTVQLSLTPDFAEFVDSTLSDTTLTLEPLIDDTTFYWRVCVEDKAGNCTDCSGYETGWAFTTYIPDAPAVFSLIGPEDEFEFPDEREFPIIFRWNLAEDPDPGDTLRYTLQLSSDEGFGEILSFEAGIEDTVAVDTLERNIYYWRVVAVDKFDLEAYSTETWLLNVSLSINDAFASLPKVYSIRNLYPNPFNPTLTVVVGLPQRAYLQVKVYNLMGQLVADLNNDVRDAGYHYMHFDGSRLASGIYFVRAYVPGHLEQVKKVVLMK